MAKSKDIHIRRTTEFDENLSYLQKQTGDSAAEIMRNALSLYAQSLNHGEQRKLRNATIMEFVNLVAEKALEQNSPKVYEELSKEASRRAREFHEL